jgi:hypothetical protein
VEIVARIVEIEVDVLGGYVVDAEVIGVEEVAVVIDLVLVVDVVEVDVKVEIVADSVVNVEEVIKKKENQSYQ